MASRKPMGLKNDLGGKICRNIGGGKVACFKPTTKPAATPKGGKAKGKGPGGHKMGHH